MTAPTNAFCKPINATGAAIDAACARIAPAWPLDRLIAVNPYWGWLELPASEAAAWLATLGGARLTASREVFRAAWNEGALRPLHLQMSCDALGSRASLKRLEGALQAPCAPLKRLALLSDIHATALHPFMATADAVTHQISQHCAAFFDDGQSAWTLDRSRGLFASWREQLAADHSLRWQQGHRWLQARLIRLRQDPAAAIEWCCDALGIPASAREAWLTGVLLAINGWASWCALRRWQARLDGADDDTIVELLAIRLAWEVLLREDGVSTARHSAWLDDWRDVGEAVRQAAGSQQDDWLFQHALELAWQQPLCERLAGAIARTNGSQASAGTPFAQAVFCIDVRSEVFRRALEAADPGLATRGFAGFFGLPIAYSPVGSDLTRPQLPGLFPPAMTASEDDGSTYFGQALRQRRQGVLQWKRRWQALQGAAGSGFSFVETCGLGYAGKLLRASLPRAETARRWEQEGITDAQLPAPRLPAAMYEGMAGAALAHPILTAMGLTGGFAPLVLLVGHGSQTANNPHAAGLDCGAFGGQAGDVNARVLAGLLNDAAVREALSRLGVVISRDVWFVAGLHNTTTDALTLYDIANAPATHRQPLERLNAALKAAGHAARLERAPALGPAGVDTRPPALERGFRERANDWSEVRPEWGLANNAGFIVAPRATTAQLNLQGRVFLHDYDWRADPDAGVLTLIMTAPMVVTNWINLQYHASTVDAGRYGSGDKVLHNVVGGGLGVFEGNGGDLRIGLPLQSVRDAAAWRHTPLRLSVFIEAPRKAIERVLAASVAVRHLVDNGWLHLLRLDSGSAVVERRVGGRWQIAAEAPVRAAARDALSV